MKMVRHRQAAIVRALWACAWLILCLSLPLSAQASLFKSSHTSVSGFGFFGNLQLKKTLEILNSTTKPRTEFDSSYIEDAIWVLDGAVQSKGYPEPTLEITLTKEDDSEVNFHWDKDFTPALSHELKGKKIAFKVIPGTLNYYTTVTITGISSLEEKACVNYFYPNNTLVSTKEDRYYTEARFHQSVASLVRDLQQNGYHEAQAVKHEVTVDKETGTVTALLTISEGPRYYIAKLTTEDETEVVREKTFTEQPYTHSFYLNYINRLRNEYYGKGYPDVTIKTKDSEPLYKNNKAFVHLEGELTPGPLIHIHAINYEGTGKTNQRIIEGKHPLKAGELLDINRAQEERDRISRLNIFKTVDLEYKKIDANNWDVDYVAELKKSIILSLIVGYGSYDQLRGGFEVEHYNIFGRAHYSKLKFIQSFKSTDIDYTYSIPELLATDMTGYGKASYLNRKEISYVRKEISASVGVDKFLKKYRTNLNVEYGYEQLEANDQDFPPDVGLDKANVSSLTVSLRKNTVDNPLFPRHGYRVFGTVELAIPYIGGNVEYQRFEVGGAYHKPITEQLLGHYGIKHGFVTTIGSVSDNLPINKRFYPGGDNSQRGYRQGQADPRDSKDNNIGAETYIQLNLETELLLTQKVSFVTFVDIVGIARTIHAYPFNRILLSPGLGLSYRTPIGPIRLEYAHNLIRRPSDPKARIFVAIGFPF